MSDGVGEGYWINWNIIGGIIAIAFMLFLLVSVPWSFLTMHEYKLSEYSCEQLKDSLLNEVPLLHYDSDAPFDVLIQYYGYNKIKANYDIRCGGKND